MGWFAVLRFGLVWMESLIDTDTLAQYGVWGICRHLSLTDQYIVNHGNGIPYGMMYTEYSLFDLNKYDNRVYTSYYVVIQRFNPSYSRVPSSVRSYIEPD